MAVVNFGSLHTSLFYGNIYFLIFSLFLSSVFYVYTLKVDTQYFSKGFNVVKNLVLSVFFISFMLYTFCVYIFFSFNNTITMNILLGTPQTAAYLGAAILDDSSIVIVYLCYLVGFISLFTLGDRFWKNMDGLPLLFLYFPLVVNLLCVSGSLFEMFIYYELLLLPSVYFVHKGSYTRKSQQANVYFLVWTQLGSLISLFGVMYIMGTFGTTTFTTLYSVNFTGREKY